MIYYPYPGWPYSAKAVIQHRFDGTEEYEVYLTFPLAMDQSVTPDKSLFEVTYDAESKPPYSVVWIDAFTLKLLVITDDIVSWMKVEYLGPSQNLRTTYNKQWEPWGPIPSLDIST